MAAQNNKLLSLMGIARRSGKIVAGFDVTIDAMNKGETTVVFLSCDAAERTERNIRRIAGDLNVNVIKINQNMDNIGKAIGSARTGVIAFIDYGFEKKAKELAKDMVVKSDE